jgi:FXSXX-COOH protein
MSLADIGDLPGEVLGEATGRVLPETPAVPVAAFNSAI